MNTIDPRPPFVWPEPRISAGLADYSCDLAYELLPAIFDSAFGIVSGLTRVGIDHIESWFRRREKFKAKLIVMPYPTSSTHQGDLERLLGLVEEFSERLSVRIRPLKEVTDRPSNALCFLAAGREPHFVTGPTEDLGLGPMVPGAANWVFRGNASLTESFRRYFDFLWANSRDIARPGATAAPHLVLPKGTEEAARAWREYCECLSNSSAANEEGELVADINPETGNVILKGKNGEPVASPSESLGLKTLDPWADRIAHLYEMGSLVSVDKRSRIPPLDTPVSPALFGDAAEIQKGSVTRKVSMRVSVIDEETLKSIEKCRKGSRAILTRFTFGLADNTRWMPDAARELFDSELQGLNESGQKLIGELLKGDLDGFLAKKRPLLESDLEAMHKQLGQTGPVAHGAVDQVMECMKTRLERAQSANFMPTLSYSTIGFNPVETKFASPWGQAFSLLLDAARFPRKAVTDAFFLRGIKASEEDLIEAMNIADDAVVRELHARGIKERCKDELGLLDSIEAVAIDQKEKCDLVFRLIDGAKITDIRNALEALSKKQEGP